MFFNTESVPIYLAMVVVVPITFDAIKIVLEDKLDFDVIINRNMLRILEAIIAIMIFPAAVIFLVLLGVHFVITKSYFAAYEILEFLTTPCFFSHVGYIISLILMFLSIQVIIILILKFIYNSL
ncbi:hypothetical protein EGW08_009215 [Elysia chlorotica]|uniref:Uncharacterized protein n=1 Tax=Elysia chlorotica TaxID=188477 RepID=A0A3S1HNL6_ELYCH|nr:hypothetical protein EGW08_009215 [Elysia chlorotica]